MNEAGGMFLHTWGKPSCANSTIVIHEYALVRPKREVLAYVVARGPKGQREYIYSSPVLYWGPLCEAHRWKVSDLGEAEECAKAHGGTVRPLVRKVAR